MKYITIIMSCPDYCKNNPPTKSLRKVVMVGRVWSMAWEDGQRGIYKFEGSTTIGVKRSHELTNSDEPHLVEGMCDKTHQHATGELLGGHVTITNDPSMTRASALLGIGQNLASMDGEPPPVVAPSATASSAALSIPHPAAKRQRTDEAGSPDKTGSIFESMRPGAPAPSQGKTVVPKPKPQPKVKAQPKAVKTTKASKGKGAGDDGTKDAALTKIDLFMTKTTTLDASVSGGTRQPGNPTPMLTDAEATVDLSEADATWYQSLKDSLESTMIFDPSDQETNFRQDCAKAIKDAQTFLSDLKSRKRSLKRRTAENSQAPLKAAGHLESIAQLFLECLKLLQCNPPTSFGSECIVNTERLLAAGAQLGNEAIKRTARWKWMDDLKHQNWGQMLDETYVFLKDHLRGDSEYVENIAANLLSQQMSLVLQKLLKGMDNDKDSAVV